MADITIDGHLYKQLPNGLVADDPVTVPDNGALRTKIINLIQVLKTGSATPVQQQQALAAILAFQLGLLDVN